GREGQPSGAIAGPGHRSHQLASPATVGVDEQPRPAGSPVRDLPRVVGPHPRADPMTVPMNDTVCAREQMLARIRAARAGAKLIEPARDYRHRGDPDPGAPALIDLL